MFSVMLHWMQSICFHTKKIKKSRTQCEFFIKTLVGNCFHLQQVLYYLKPMINTYYFISFASFVMFVSMTYSICTGSFRVQNEIYNHTFTISMKFEKEIQSSNKREKKKVVTVLTSFTCRFKCMYTLCPVLR